MRNWRIAKSYMIMDYLFSIAVAEDNPHLLGIFARPFGTIDKMEKIHSEYCSAITIDRFAETVPTIISKFLLEKQK